MEDTDYEGGRATIHYQTHWTKEPMQKTYRGAKHMSDDELKAQHYKLFGGSVTKIERDHEYEPKKEKIHMNDRPGHLMDDVDAHVKPALDEEAQHVGVLVDQGDVLLDAAPDDVADRVGRQVDRREDRRPQLVAQPLPDRLEQV